MLLLLQPQRPSLGRLTQVCKARLSNCRPAIIMFCSFSPGPTPVAWPPVSDVTSLNTWHLLYNSQTAAHVCASGWQQETVNVLQLEGSAIQSKSTRTDLKGTYVIASVIQVSELLGFN